MEEYDSRDIDESQFKRVLSLWYNRVSLTAKLYRKRSHRYSLFSKWLLIGNVISSIMFLFLANVHWVYNRFQNTAGEFNIFTVATGLFGLALVLTMVLQFLFDYEKRAIEDRFAWGAFEALKSKIERYAIGPKFEMGMLHNVSREITLLNRHLPMLATNKDNEFKENLEAIVGLKNEIFDADCQIGTEKTPAV